MGISITEQRNIERKFLGDFSIKDKYNTTILRSMVALYIISDSYEERKLIERTFRRIIDEQLIENDDYIGLFDEEGNPFYFPELPELNIYDPLPKNCTIV